MNHKINFLPILPVIIMIIFNGCIDSGSQDNINESALIASDIQNETKMLQDYTYEWQKSYSDYLNDYENLLLGIYIDDINGDNIPEVILDINGLGSLNVLYFINTEMKVLELTVASFGHTNYIEETGQFINLHFYGHTTGTQGCWEQYIYSWTPDGYVMTVSMERNTNNYLDGYGFINGEKVYNTEFNEQIDYYKKIEEQQSTDINFIKLYDENLDKLPNSKELLNQYVNEKLFPKNNG